MDAKRILTLKALGFGMASIPTLEKLEISTIEDLLKQEETTESILEYARALNVAQVSSKKTGKPEKNGPTVVNKDPKTLMSEMNFGSIKAKIVEWKGKLSLSMDGFTQRSNGVFMGLSKLDDGRIDPVELVATCNAHIALKYEQVKGIETVRDWAVKQANALGVNIPEGATATEE